jgi:hypothetical protein
MAAWAGKGMDKQRDNSSHLLKREADFVGLRKSGSGIKNILWRLVFTRKFPPDSYDRHMIDKIKAFFP